MHMVAIVCGHQIINIQCICIVVIAISGTWPWYTLFGFACTVWLAGMSRCTMSCVLAIIFNIHYGSYSTNLYAFAYVYTWHCTIIKNFTTCSTFQWLKLSSSCDHVIKQKIFYFVVCMFFLRTAPVWL